MARKAWPLLAQGFVQQALAGKVPGQRYTNQIAGAGYPPDAQANVLKRFLDTVSDLVAMGFFVLLDNQMQQDKLVRVRLRKDVRTALRLHSTYASWGGSNMQYGGLDNMMACDACFIPARQS